VNSPEPSCIFKRKTEKNPGFSSIHRLSIDGPAEDLNLYNLAQTQENENEGKKQPDESSNKEVEKPKRFPKLHIESFNRVVHHPRK
jgi:hypothetical protein